MKNAIIPTEQTTMTTTDAATRLAVIEYRLHQHISAAAEHFIGVGRCLNEAKATNLVPHGEWDNWVMQHTTMGIRQAQRCMKAAAEVPEGSAMERLPFTKVQAILRLNSAEREETAQRVLEDGTSLRELEAQVRAANGRAAKAEAEKLEAERRAEKAKADAKAAEDRAAAAQSAQADTISPKAQAEINRLRADLADAESEAERQAEERQKAQTALLNFKAEAARGGRDDGELTDMVDVASAVRVFIGSVGVLPHMGKTLADASEAERDQLRQHVEMVAEWVEGARRALNTIIIDGDM